jgi:hypothetical protein
LDRIPGDTPLGPPVPSWLPRQLPPLAAMRGRFCRVEPIDSTRHGEALYVAYATDREGRLWTYLPWGPYSGPEELSAQIDAARASGVRPEYALVDLASGKPFGQASYLNIDPAAGSIEVGGIVYAPAFQRGIAATEAMYLMMRRAFDELGYRRYAGSAIRSMPDRGQQQSGSASHSRASGARPTSTRGATGIRRGSRSSMANGQRSRPLSSVGSRQRILTPRAVSECACRS